MCMESLTGLVALPQSHPGCFSYTGYKVIGIESFYRSTNTFVNVNDNIFPDMEEGEGKCTTGQR